MPRPDTPLSRFRCLCSAFFLAASTFSLEASLFSSPEEEWLPITPEELAATAPAIEPNAPAEILFRKIEIDDTDLPETRVLSQYIRFKVYKPERAEDFTRISLEEAGYSVDDTELKARMILPNGTIKTFGKEAIRERTLVESAAEKSFLNALLGQSGVERQQKFLAISGIEAGAIVEYRITNTARHLFAATSHIGQSLQVYAIPTRKVEFVDKSTTSDDISYGCFLINKSIGNGVLVDDREKHEVRVTASNIPSLFREPLSASKSDTSLTVLNCYRFNNLYVRSDRNSSQGRISYQIDPNKDGLWAPLATGWFIDQEFRAAPTKRVEKLARELTEKAATPIAKAQLIHQFCQERFVEFIKLPKRTLNIRTYDASHVSDLDDVLDYPKKPKMVGCYETDFLWLAMAMYQSVGLECRQIRLPDRRVLSFNRMLVTPLLLQGCAAQVKIGDNWIFSYPNSTALLPLGGLTWYSEGQEALIARPGKEEFIKTPIAAAKQSLLGSGGTFTLSDDGTLAGTGVRKYVGHSANVIRSLLLRRRDPQAATRYFGKILNELFKNEGASDEPDLFKEDGEDSEESKVSDSTGEPKQKRPITIEKITGLETRGEIEVTFKLRIAGFAVSTGDQLILRPSLFRHRFASPFTSSTRKNHVRFPYAWQELDSINIRLPAGYVPDISEPAQIPPRSGFFYRNACSYDEAKRTLRFRREFLCQQTVVPVEAYLPLKEWFDEVVHGDQYELILTKSAAGTGQTQEPASSAGAPKS